MAENDQWWRITVLAGQEPRGHSWKRLVQRASASFSSLPYASVSSVVCWITRFRYPTMNTLPSSRSLLAVALLSLSVGILFAIPKEVRAEVKYPKDCSINNDACSTGTHKYCSVNCGALGCTCNAFN